ncbi:MAG: type II toxin-antitoxin system VapC family toxin [Polyangiaceae bacterium]|nr:type II toxin-antitoxin system VapC family toxin [Polyangiaceae bacterium]
MKLLLDTCVLLWLMGDREKLSNECIRALSSEDAELFVSAISAFEIAVKVRKGKLVLPLSAREWFSAALRTHRIVERPITSAIAAFSCEVPLSHNDPADRMIVATAMLEGLTLITSDSLIQSSPGLSIIW